MNATSPIETVRRAAQSWPLRLCAVLAMAAVALTSCSKEAESQGFTGKQAMAAVPAVAQTAVAHADSADPMAGDVVAQADGAKDKAAADADGKVVGGDDSYTLKLSAPETLGAGESGTVRVTVVPKTGWKMNKEFPTKLKVTPPSGVEVVKDSQTAGDAEHFDEGSLTFAVNFKTSSAGEKAFQAKFKFAVCTDATCDPKKQDLAWVVAVK